MESYRVYKSLNYEDFVENLSFVMAKCGILVTPFIQDANYMYEETNDRVNFIINAIKKISEDSVHVKFEELDRYYFIIPINWNAIIRDIWEEYREAQIQGDLIGDVAVSDLTRLCMNSFLVVGKEVTKENVYKIMKAANNTMIYDEFYNEVMNILNISR